VNSKEKSQEIHPNFFQRTEEEGSFVTHFIALTQKPDNDIIWANTHYKCRKKKPSM
jgi:hypothetical protein